MVIFILYRQNDIEVRDILLSYHQNKKLHPTDGNFSLKQRVLRKTKTNQNTDLWSSSHQIHLPNTSTSKAQRMLRKEEQKDCGSQKTREFAVRLCILIIPEVTPITSLHHNCPRNDMGYRKDIASKYIVI